jgi:hypothetical protein
MGENLGDVPFELARAQITEFDGEEVPMHPEHRRDTDGQMDVRAALLRTQLQKRVYTRQSAYPLIAIEMFCPVRAVESTSRP